jgi:DNA end-binding protein Ku
VQEIAKQRQRWLTYAANSLPSSDLRDTSDAALHIDTLWTPRQCPRMATQARSLASLTISFGLVAIPVKLYSATVASERVAFNLLREKDGSRVKQQYVAVNDGELVDRSEMAKGYEFSKDQFVMFSPDEVKALEDATTHSIDISQFVPLESFDPVYFDGTYYLSPDKGGSKPYSLLATALRRKKQCAVGRWVFRGKEHIVVIRPFDDGLAMHQ